MDTLKPTKTPVFRIDDAWTLAELGHARAEMQEYMIALDEQIGEIKTQLEYAKARRKSEGVHADPQWYARASSALRHKGRLRVNAQNFVGELNRRIRAQRAKESGLNDERSFVRAAKSLLSAEIYAQIWEEVRRQRMVQDDG